MRKLFMGAPVLLLLSGCTFSSNVGCSGEGVFATLCENAIPVMSVNCAGAERRYVTTITYDEWSDAAGKPIPRKYVEAQQVCVQ